MRRIIILVLIGLMAIPLRAEEKEKKQEKPQYNLASANKKVFLKIENDNVDGERAKVSFFNKKDKLIGEWEIQDNAMDSYYLSRNGKYLLIELLMRKQKEIEDKKIYVPEYIFIDNTGKEISRFESEEGSWRWSPSEDYFTLYCGEGKIKFVNLGGKILWERDNIYGSHISPDGEYTVIITKDKELELNNKNGGIIFTKSFKKEFEKNIKMHDIDVNGNIIISQRRAKKIYVLNRKGEIKFKKDIGIIPLKAKFSKKNKSEIEIKGRSKIKNKTERYKTIKWRE